MSSIGSSILPSFPKLLPTGTCWVRADVAWCLGFALLLAVCAQRLDRVERTDPDRAYHYAISRMASGGTVLVVPQVIGLGWDERFDEREWLFHVLCSAGWSLAGERGVDAVCFLLSCINVVLI